MDEHCFIHRGKMFIFHFIYGQQRQDWLTLSVYMHLRCDGCTSKIYDDSLAAA